jgi:hypothetical protein
VEVRPAVHVAPSSRLPNEAYNRHLNSQLPLTTDIHDRPGD